MNHLIKPKKKTGGTGIVLTVGKKGGELETSIRIAFTVYEQNESSKCQSTSECDL